MIVPAKGTADVLREGVEAEGGRVDPVETGVLTHASHTLIYPDRRLLARLKAASPDIEDAANVSFIAPDALSTWAEAIGQLLDEKGIVQPAR